MRGEQILEQVRLLSGELTWSSFDEINDAYEELCQQAGFRLHRVRDEGAVVLEANQSQYLLPMHKIRRLEEIFVQRPDDRSQWVALPIVDDVTWEHKYHDWLDSTGTVTASSPRWGRIAGDMLEVVPTPDGTYPVRLIYIANQAPIERETEPEIPATYHRTLAKAAAIKVLSLPVEGLNEDAFRARTLTLGNLRREVGEAKMNIAFDMSRAPSVGVAMPKRRMMRT